MPVLILQGGRDPVVAGGGAVASYRNGREVVVPHGAHLFDGLSNMECLDGLVNAFLQSADAGALDATCVSEMLPPPFAVAAETQD